MENYSTVWKISWLLMTVIFCCNAKPLRKKVCIIGAGPAGLTSLKQLSTYPKEFEPIAFERNSQIGGQWAYTDNGDVDEHGLPVHSGIYKYLKTTATSEDMVFPDFPKLYGDPGVSLKHETVLKYLHNYTQTFDLNKYFKLNTLVEKVTTLRENEWVVKTRNLNTNENKETLCDAVMVCNGNFFKPNIPNIPGMDTFPGKVLHSHAYRRPEDFANQTVVILGASFSGRDIGNEITSHADMVYISHRHEKSRNVLPPNMVEVSGVIAANGSQLILSDSTRIIADAFIFCTGYVYDYPFFDASVGISVDKGKYVHPLYKHLIHAERPTMAILGIPQPGLPFPESYVQAHYFTSVLRDKVQLPNQAEMLKDSKLPPGKPVSKAHYMESEVLDYYKELADASGAKPILSSHDLMFMSQMSGTMGMMNMFQWMPQIIMYYCDFQ